MKAKVVKSINLNDLEKDCWMIMIQKEKGKKYNVGLLVDNKPYYTYHEDEAIEKVKKLNIEFKNK